ncbi:MAG: RIP metalloprotease RseP [Gammaproteobacteria bacterium]|nr:RIP metalloprotease RseP [Gammaproteobacteria bacterium]
MFDFLHSTPTLVTAVVGFILTISFLVTIHEYGHFWVARKFGVKIEKFSVGFGKPIFKWHGKRDNTEYSISWIPLGGYVKMYGEEFTSNNNTENSQCSETSDANNSSGSFYALPAYKRFLIAFAGPAVNLIFAVLALWFLFVLGVPAFKPYIGSVKPQSIFATANIQSGTQIYSINGNASPTMTETSMHLVNNIGNKKTPITTIDDNGIKRTSIIDLSHLEKGSELAISDALGFSWEITEVRKKIVAQIATVGEGSPAQRSGLLAHDRVISINNKEISTWEDFVKFVQSNPEKAIGLTIIRNGSKKVLSLTPGRHPENSTLGYAGISPVVSKDLYTKYHALQKFGALEALPMAIKSNYLQAALTLKMLGRLVTGNASIKNMGGPLTIADYSGKTLKLGYVEYLKFLAAISLTLAVMNLLPIPVLDGGHMMLCMYEMIKRKPPSEMVVNIIFGIGKIIVLGFMLLVLSVDIWKYIT